MEWIEALRDVAVIIAIVIISRSAGRAGALDEALDHERDKYSGWEDEAKFWRNYCHPEAEERRIANRLEE
ncbi:MAG: hypothetical protein A2Y38_02495 [Spirochaetes bacterium GWB1_59_5]|nr:MAG: hypothetical protein A2Y38_02495 [Spirochaetes bacterium GWB1_59_5]